MSDIVEQIRSTTEQMACTASVDMTLWDKHSNACLKAAAEILRLRERLAEADEANRGVSDENERLRKGVDRLLVEHQADEQRKFDLFDQTIDLSCENEKLRAALQTFSDAADAYADCEPHEMVAVNVADLRAAAAALKETRDDE